MPDNIHMILFTPCGKPEESVILSKSKTENPSLKKKKWQKTFLKIIICHF